MARLSTIPLIACFIVLGCGDASVDTPTFEAPSIRVEPSSVAAARCASATFTVDALGEPPLTYQWRRDGRAIDGATAASFTLGRVGPADDGSLLSVTVSNDGGAVTSSGARLTIRPEGPAIRFADGPVLGIAASGADVFWTDGRGVYRANKDCSGPVEPLYAGSPSSENAIAIAVSGATVYWSDEAQGVIRALKVDGTGPISATSPEPTGPVTFALGNGQVLWPSLSAGIRSMPAGGGAMAALAPESAPLSAGGLAVDDAFAFWTDVREGSVKRVSLAGGQVETIATGQGYVGNIAVHAGSLYWCSNLVDPGTGQTQGRIVKAATDGSSPSILAVGSQLTHQLVTDGVSVYWTSGALDSTYAGTGAVSVVGVTGVPAARVMAADLDLPFSIDLDAGHLYWAHKGALMMAPR